MRTIKRSPRQLVLEKEVNTGASLDIGVFQLGISLAVLLGLASSAVSSSVALNCHQNIPRVADCRVIAYRWGLVETERVITGITSVEIQTKESEDSKGNRQVQHWVVARTKTGTADLLRFNLYTRVSRNLEGMDSLVTSFNSFLLSDQATWNCYVDDYGQIFVAILIPTAAAVFVSTLLRVGAYMISDGLAHKPKELLIFDKQQRQIFSLLLGVGAYMISDGLAQHKSKELLIFDKQQRQIFWQRPQDNYNEEQPLHKLQAIEVHEAKIGGTRQVFQVYALLEGRGLLVIEEDCDRTHAEKLSKELSKFLAVPVYHREV